MLCTVLLAFSRARTRHKNSAQSFAPASVVKKHFVNIIQECRAIGSNQFRTAMGTPIATARRVAEVMRAGRNTYR
jgi:hypothetical protein